MATKRKPIETQVIVVGAATGPIGQAVARAAARRHARLMLVDSDACGLGEAARAINNAGGRADFAVAAPTDADAMTAAAFAALARFGRIDSWIDAGSPEGWRTTAGALRGRGNVLVVINGEAGDVETLRGELAPTVTLGSVRAGPEDDPQRMADAILAVAERPGRDEGAAGGLRGRLARYRPTVATAAIGLGALALAAGTVAALRQRRSS